MKWLVLGGVAAALVGCTKSSTSPGRAVETVKMERIHKTTPLRALVEPDTDGEGKNVASTGPLSGKRYCIRGALKSMSWADARVRLEMLGGTVVGGLSDKPHVLIAGDTYEPDYDRPEFLGVEVFDEESFLDLLGDYEVPTKHKGIRGIMELSATWPGRKEPVYFFDVNGAPKHAGYNRTGGLPPGIAPADWPRFKGEPMVHLFTLDLAQMPALRKRIEGSPRTLSVFLWSPEYNEAFVLDSGQSAVLTRDESSAATPGGAPDGATIREQGTFAVTTVDVPSSAWTPGTLNSFIYLHSGRAGGEPIWLQGADEPDDGYVMQFDPGFVSVNTGDGGVMYVYETGAFFQSH